jgi:hypothetical protein
VGETVGDQNAELSHDLNVSRRLDTTMTRCQIS